MPNYDCEKSFDIKKIYEYLDKNDFERIDQILLKKYLNNGLNIIKCPKIGCNFAGTLSEDNIFCDEF